MPDYRADNGDRKGRGWLSARLCLVALACVAIAISIKAGDRQRKQPARDFVVHQRVAAPMRPTGPRRHDVRTHPPMALPPASRVRAKLDREDVRRALDKVRLAHRASLSILLHCAMVFGLDTPAPGYSATGKPITIRALLFDSKAYGEYFDGRSVFVATAEGLANRVRIAPDAHWQIERQAHPGQLLCELAKHGVPLGRKLKTDAGVFYVDDLLRAATASFAPGEPQIEWTSMALSLYLPPKKTWLDKSGREFSFDDLARELLGRNVAAKELSCAGIHVLEALAVLLRVDERHHIVSDAVRRRVRERLASCAAHLAETQSPDGNWARDWNSPRGIRGLEPMAATSPRHERVHVTGHHAGWMLLLPDDLTPPDSVFERAAAWLLKSLLEWERTDLMNTYCPYSHAAHVIKTIAAD